MAGVTRLELATSGVTGRRNRKYAKFNASFYACKQRPNKGAVDTRRQLVLAGHQFGHQKLVFAAQLLDCLADHARLGCLKHADHFPLAFNSSPVLPPCLRRSSAVSVRSHWMAPSSGVWPL